MYTLRVNSFQFSVFNSLLNNVFCLCTHGTRTRCSLMCTVLHAYVVRHINYNNVYKHAPIHNKRSRIIMFDTIHYPQHLDKRHYQRHNMYNEIEPLQYNVVI